MDQPDTALTRREVVRLAAGVSLAAAGNTAASGQQQSRVPWFRDLLVGIEIGPTGANDRDKIYMARATGKMWVDALHRANAQYGVIFMKDQDFTYYNSKLVRKCPNLGSRDLLQECVAEARKARIPIVAYQQIQYDTGAWKAHPEWRMKDHEGRDMSGRLCYNSGYLEFNQRVADELLQYDIAGFHVDMLDFGFGPPVGCWCERCQALFTERYGVPMPVGVSWDERWEHMLEFRCASNTRFCQEMQAHIQGHNPNISVDYNYHGYPPFSWYPGELPVMHARNGDFVTAEGLPWVFGHSNPGMLSLFMQGARVGGAVQGVTSRSVYNYHDFTVRPTAEMKWEVFTYLAHGAQCTIVDKANYDGSVDIVAYDRMGQIFAEAKRKRDDFFHTPLPEVGLYYSARSRDWYGREDSPKYTAAFLGAHRALVQAHIPMGVVFDESVTPERLQQFPVVYLANTAIISPREAELFRSYVGAGGSLIVTGLAGLFDGYGRSLKANVLGDLLGAEFRQAHTTHPDNYLQLPAIDNADELGGLGKDIPPDWPILTWGPIAAYSATTGRGFGQVLLAHRSAENQWRNLMSPDRPVGPAIIVNRFGKGRTVLLPCLPDAAFIERYRVPEHRNLIRNVVRFLNPKPPVVVSAPVNIETVITMDRQRNRILIHMLAFWAPPTATGAAFDKGRQVLPPMMEEALEYTATIRVNRPLTKVAVGPNSTLTVSGNDLKIATAEVHEVVSIAL